MTLFGVSVKQGFLFYGEIMAPILFLDFETFSECDIKCGSFRYAQDKTTDIICLAYSFGGETLLWHPEIDLPENVVNHIVSGGEVRSWNVTFEYSIMNYVGIRYGFPKIRPDQVCCTMTDSLALALPSTLKETASVLGVDEKKDATGKRLINLLSKPRKATKNKPYTRVTKDIDPDSFGLMYKYCIQDVKTEMAIYNALPRHIKDFELDMFRETLKINEKGIYVDSLLVDGVIRDKKLYEEKLNNEIYTITNGGLVSTNSRPQSLKWLEENGVKLEGYTKSDVKKALQTDISENCKRFLEIRTELSRTPIKKYDFLKKAMCSDGTIKNNLIFHKATTGRFAGVGLQIQNMPRDSVKDPEALIEKFQNAHPVGDRNIFNESICLIRNVLTAKDDERLIVSDFSGIENRVVAWLSGDTQTLNDFRNDVDQYKTAASSIFKVPYDQVTSEQRQLGKISVLSCCFGGGHKTFHKVCNEGWGIDVSMDLAKDVVDGYREKYEDIVQLWYKSIEAASRAVGGGVHGYKKLAFRKMGDFLYMRLPSKRLLAYYMPEMKMVTTPWGKQKLALTHMGSNTYTRKWERLVMTHGRLIENATQAVARDILNIAVKRAIDKGFNVVGLVHDEIIATVKKDSPLTLKDLDEVMQQKIDWCEDLPIDSEGFEAVRYRK